MSNKELTSDVLSLKAKRKDNDFIDNLGIVEREFLGGNHPNSVLTQEGLTIIVVNGSIASQVTGAIVNSVGGSFDLKQGALSNVILQEAGPEIQKELTAVRPKNLRYGDVFKTKGYKLQSLFVFHGVLKEWNNDKDDAEDVLCSFIRNALESTSKEKLTSIAIPAVGTGVLQFPNDVVVNCLFKEADDFSAKNKDTSINEIRFVVYAQDKKMFDAFEKKLSEIKAHGEENEDKVDVYVNDFNSDDSEDEKEMINNIIARKKKESENTMKPFGSDFPATWQQQPKDKTYGKTEISSNDAEFKAVTKRIMETKGSSVKNILKIERIENRTQYRLYMVQKKDMEDRNRPPRVENERILWHGTVKDSLNNIFSYGFNRAYCGKNEFFFGRGVYFARDFSYSAQTTYSRPDPDGTKYIFMCRVLTGTFTVGNKEMIEPEMKPGTNFRHDCTVNNFDEPTIFVVFKDAQAYPEYLVSFN